MAAFLVGGGLGLAFALVWLRRGARRRRRVLSGALALRARFERDPLATLSGCSDWIADADLPGMEWEGEWYGARVSGSIGAPPSAQRPFDRLSQAFSQTDVQLRVTMSLRGVRGEARLFAEQAAQWLFVVLEGALAARELALTASMAQRARLAVFVQHDMRNLAQWVELLAEDLGQAETSDVLLEQAQRLRQGAAAARDRAQRIMAAMSRNSAQAAAETPAWSDLHWRVLDLRAELEQGAALHQVALNFTGEWSSRPEAPWDPQAWAVVLDNILGNISRLSREILLPAQCAVRWLPRGERGETGELSFDTPQLPIRVPLDRLFEPWVGTSPTGSGLGLYQARRAALAAHGDLWATAFGSGLSVTLCINCKNS